MVIIIQTEGFCFSSRCRCSAAKFEMRTMLHLLTESNDDQSLASQIGVEVETTAPEIVVIDTTK